MATATKHMERSRRSHRNNVANMNYFKSKSYHNAYTKQYLKFERMSLGQMLAGVVRKATNVMRGDK